MAVKALQDFVEELLALLHKLFERVPPDPEPPGKYGVGQATGGLGDEPGVRRHGLKVRLHRAPEFARLPSEFQVVVQNLPPFLK